MRLGSELSYWRQDTRTHRFRAGRFSSIVDRVCEAKGEGQILGGAVRTGQAVRVLSLQASWSSFWSNEAMTQHAGSQVCQGQLFSWLSYGKITKSQATGWLRRRAGELHGHRDSGSLFRFNAPLRAVTNHPDTVLPLISIRRKAPIANSKAVTCWPSVRTVGNDFRAHQGKRPQIRETSPNWPSHIMVL